MSFKDFKSIMKEKGMGGGGFLELEPGENKIRIVSDFVDYLDNGKYGLKTKFACWAIDRKDGLVKPFTFGAAIFSGIGNLAIMSETAFDELPPYDIIIKKEGSGIDTEYTVVAARQNSVITEDEKAAIEKAGDINRVVERLVEKRKLAPVVREEDIPVVEGRGTSKPIEEEEDVEEEDEEDKVKESDLPF